MEQSHENFTQADTHTHTTTDDARAYGHFDLQSFSIEGGSAEVALEYEERYVVIALARDPDSPTRDWRVWGVKGFSTRYEAVAYASRCRFEVSKLVDAVRPCGIGPLRDETGRVLDHKYSHRHGGIAYRVLKVNF